MRSLFRLGLLSALFAVVFSGAFLLWIWVTLPDPSILIRNYPVVQSLGAGRQPEIRFSAKRPGTWASLRSISKLARAAIIISEDGKFYRHQGVDLEELSKVIQQDLKHLEFKRGASTITQQLIKNVFLTREKSLIRKLQELILSLQVEKLLTKDQILEIYLNVIEFGPNLHGIDPASRHYFGKPASELSAKEGAFLAMLLPNPVRYSSSFRQRELTPYARRIIRDLLEKMVILGHLTEEEAESEWRTPLSFEQVDLIESQDPDSPNSEDSGDDGTEMDQTLNHS